MITETGKDLIRQYLAGSIMNYAQAIAVGAGSKTSNQESQYMDFEFARVPIEATALVKTGADLYAVNFRAVLGPDICGRVNEVGLFSELREPTTDLPSTQIIALFEETEEWWDGDTALKISDRDSEEDLAKALVGDTFANPNITFMDGENILLQGNSYTYDFADMDISAYSPGDTIHLFVSCTNLSEVDTSLQLDNIEARLTFYDGSGQSVSVVLGGDGYTYSGEKKIQRVDAVTATHANHDNGYVLLEEFSQLNAGWDNTFDSSNVDKVELEIIDRGSPPDPTLAKGWQNDLMVHALAFHDEGELSPTNGMVSRLAGTQLQGFWKKYGSTVTVEFQLPLGAI